MSARKRVCAALTALACAGVFATAHAADSEPVRSGPLQQISTSNFIKADSIPWQMVCEWTDGDGKAHAVWTVGLERPGADVVPTTVLCVTVKRFIFSNGRGFSESHFQKDRSTASQQGYTTNLMYIVAGHGRNMVDGQTMETEPGDAFAQIAEKPHQNAAIGAGYVQIATSLPTVGPDEAIKVSDADLKRGPLIHHKDAPKIEICLFNGADGGLKALPRNAENKAAIPAGAACFTVYSLLALPNGTMAEVNAKKGDRLPPITEKLDMLIYIVKGKVKATIGGETEVLKAGDALFNPGGVPHSAEFLKATTQVEIQLPNTGKAP
jgi:quercetin dioxygenase-like cupin family protein